MPCVAHVGACARDWRPKCGRDGRTYSNQCMARNACQFDTTDGPCPSPLPMPRPSHRPPPSPSSLSSLLSSLLVGGAPVGGSGNALGGHYTGSSEQNLMGDWGNQTDLGEASHVQHLVRQSMLGLQNIVGVQFYPTVDGASETVETLQVRVRSARVQVVAGKKYQIEAELTPSCNRPSMAAELTPPPCRVSVLSLEIYEQAWSSTMRLKVATQRVVAPPKTYNLLFGQTGPADMGLDLMGLASSMAVLQEAAESKGAVLEEAGGSDMPQKSLEYRLPEPCVVGWLVGCTEDNRYPVCGKNGVTYDNGCKADNACQLVGRTDGACSALKASPLTRTALLASIVLVAAGVLFGVASVVRVRAANRAATADQETLRVGPKSDDDAATLAQPPLRIVRVELEKRETRVPI